MEEKQNSLPGFRSDPALYREMSIPHASSEALNEALQKFFDEIGELRKKHKMRDVFICVQCGYVAQDGTEEIDAAAHHGMGDSARHEALLAFALGQVQGERQEIIARYMARGIKKTGRRD